jgi:hypothetical protein
MQSRGLGPVDQAHSGAELLDDAVVRDGGRPLEQNPTSAKRRKSMKALELAVAKEGRC